MDNPIFLQYSLYFMIYGFLGWIVEVLYTGIGSGHFTNRGFLYSTFLPIYGFGAIFIIYFLTPVKGSPLLVYTYGVLLTTILEYLTAVVLENVFHVKWWDYSKYKFNFQGRICLRNSLLFGVLVLFVMYGTQPYVDDIVSSIPFNSKRIIVDVFYIIIITDLYFTLRKLNNLPVRDITLLNTKKRNREEVASRLRANLTSEKFINKYEAPLKSLLAISLLIGIVSLLFINLYAALALIIIVLLVLYATFKKKDKS